jgi:hypothetical protein
MAEAASAALSEEGVMMKTKLAASAPAPTDDDALLSHAWSIPAAWQPNAEEEAACGNNGSNHLAPLPLTAEETVLLPGNGRALALTLPSTAWADDNGNGKSSGSGSTLVARLSSELVARRNRFVCLQVATMAAEQLASVSAARAACDARALRRAAAMFLSTLEVEGAIVAAAIHYPRARSKAPALSAAAAAGEEEEQERDSGGLFPHVYVELLCTNAPGRGYGTALLRHVEAFAAAHAEPLLRAALDEASGSSSDADSSDSSGSNVASGSSTNSLASIASSGASASTNSGSPSAAKPLRLRGIKLLAVESAAAFYAANGYAPPDAAREMFRPL